MQFSFRFRQGGGDQVDLFLRHGGEIFITIGIRDHLAGGLKILEHGLDLLGLVSGRLQFRQFPRQLRQLIGAEVGAVRKAGFNFGTAGQNPLKIVVETHYMSLLKAGKLAENSAGG